MDTRAKGWAAAIPLMTGIAIVLAACSNNGGPGIGSGPSPGSASGGGEPGDITCPINDLDFCDVLVPAAEALTIGDHKALVDLSGSDRLVCKEEDDPSLFPQCADEKVLRGYFISGAAFRIEVIPKDDYSSYLRTVLEGVDPSFSDDRGPGRVELLGVGTCGPDDPERRSYHLVFTAGVREPGADSAERVLGSFEIVNRDREWTIGFFLFDRASQWEGAFSDPFTELGCPPLQSLTDVT